jgi:flavin reductase (DIM6/NTAB) family NADH-FMN oxidoreductase RutF
VQGKRAVRLLPWPVTLIGAYHEGKHNVMTASWVSQVSFRPPLVMVSIAPERHTYGLIQKSGEFVVSILTADQAEVAQFCGSRSGRDVDKISALGLKTRSGQAVKVPVLEDCLANIECRVVATHPAGDHVLFVGEVVGGSAIRPDAPPLLMLDWKPGKFSPIGSG